ncbi:hypothetical protein [Gordonia soli]|uniref:Uncharacterized protein n=1 Tax=Gordonia soli NBRC 108243 TaxID=1223545 RepID=M0QNP8_9ACTN|nr:hypothetical protein [Gordonia soli]GAC69876.1 hypothetical protein GS4_28_01240 [Gordonia soli NBRC 108243]
MSTRDRDATENDSRDHGHRAPGLGLVGLAALAVAGWGLAGGPDLPDGAGIGWVAVIVGVIVGLVLIATGARSRGD